MGARGPKPTPSAIKRRRGTFRKDRAAANEAKISGTPACPTWLNAEAKREWKRLLPQLEAKGLIDSIDRNALARYCALWARWREAEKTLAKEGEVTEIKNDDGEVKYVQQSPYVAIARSLSEQLQRLEQCLGLNPSARTRINCTPADAGESKNKGKGRFFPGGPLARIGG